MKKNIVFSTLSVLLLVPCGAPSGQESASPDAGQTQTRRAEAVSQAVFDRIQQSQVASSADDHAAAVEILTSLLDKGRLSDYERSNVYQYLGYAHNAAGDTASAIDAFEQVLRTPELEPQVRKTTLYVLAQLSTIEERYGAALAFIDTWFDLEAEPAPVAYILHAQILYHLERYRDMTGPIETALAVAAARNIEAKENWYALLAFAYFQQEDYAGIRDVNEILLETWPKKQYWLYLANAYRELQHDAGLLAAYDVLNVQGLLQAESELTTLAQLYLQNDLPFQAGTLLEKAIDDGRVTRSVSNLRLLSQAWSLAQEHDRAIVPLRAAAALDDDGGLYVRLANAFLSLGRHRDCAESVRGGFEKGDVRNKDHAEVTLGICLYHLQDYVDARRAFMRAAATARSETTAYRWISTIDNDLERLRHIERAEAAARERRNALARRRDL